MNKFVEGAEAFIEHCQGPRGLSPFTVIAYKNDLNEFLDWLPEFKEIAFHTMASAYVQHFQKKGYASTTIGRKVSTVRTFFVFLIKEHYFSKGVLPLKFYTPKQSKKLPFFLSPDEIESLRNAAIKKRDICMIDILFTSGVRVSELVGINLEDVDLETGEFRVTGKGDKDRVAFMSKKALASLKDYLTEYERTPKEALILNYKNNRIDVRSIRRILDELKEAAKIEKPVYPHIFRHSFATHLLNNDVNLRVVQELLGHTSISSTQIYTHVNVKRLKDVYLKTHPRALELTP